MTVITANGEQSFLEAADETLTALTPLLPFESAKKLAVVLVPSLVHHNWSPPNLEHLPLLPVTLTSCFMTLGPLLETQHSICLACLEYWIRTAAWNGWTTEIGRREQSYELAVNLLAESIREHDQTGTIAGLTQNIVSFEYHTAKRASHRIYPRRDCETCRARTLTDSADLTVHCSPLTGIVREIELTSHPTAGVYVAIGRHVSPLPINGKGFLLKERTSLGRGATPTDAVHGCIGEAIERYSLVYRGNESLVSAALGDLPGIDPRDILLFSESQYRSREDWNQREDERYWVPEQFDSERPIDWIRGLELATGETIWVPAACCLMWYRFPPNQTHYARADTIGCASGVTLAKALAGALMELIERDAIAIWWYNQIWRPGLIVESFEHGPLLALRNQLEHMGRQLFILDLTTDLEVPAYVAVAPRHDGTEPLFAAAANSSPATAAWRAASEVLQMIVYIRHKKRADGEIARWIGNATTSIYPYLIPANMMEAPADSEKMSAVEECAWCVQKLVNAGLRPIEVNLSRNDVVLHTVRTVVPGLRHIWNRRAPGRLYDVPVRMGWRKSPLTEDELNSICCMI